jgi:hypothetical protein
MMHTIQEVLFKTALKEEGIDVHGFRLDHGVPMNYNGGKEYNLVYPKSYLEELEIIDIDNKPIDYFFIGTMSGDHRQFLKRWDKPNSIIRTSQQNKFIHPKDDKVGYYGENFFNRPYFTEMATSKFVLAPAGCSAFKPKYKAAGTFIWSYRFWEAVMVGSIPITNEPDPRWHEEYKFYNLDDDHIYRKDWADHNFKVFKRNHFIWT